MIDSSEYRNDFSFKHHARVTTFIRSAKGPLRSSQHCRIRCSDSSITYRSTEQYSSWVESNRQSHLVILDQCAVFPLFMHHQYYEIFASTSMIRILTIIPLLELTFESYKAWNPSTMSAEAAGWIFGRMRKELAHSSQACCFSTPPLFLFGWCRVFIAVTLLL